MSSRRQYEKIDQQAAHPNKMCRKSQWASFGVPCCCFSRPFRCSDVEARLAPAARIWVATVAMVRFQRGCVSTVRSMCCGTLNSASPVVLAVVKSIRASGSARRLMLPIHAVVANSLAVPLAADLSAGSHDSCCDACSVADSAPEFSLRRHADVVARSSAAVVLAAMQVLSPKSILVEEFSTPPYLPDLAAHVQPATLLLHQPESRHSLDSCSEPNASCRRAQQRFVARYQPKDRSTTHLVDRCRLYIAYLGIEFKFGRVACEPRAVS